MKKVGIITIYDNNNYGNRLQNYATQIFLERLGQYDVETIKNNANLSKPQKYSSLQLRKIKNLVIKMKKFNKRKLKLYKEFNKNINFNKKYFDYFKKSEYTQYNYYIIGSDQVWNPNYRLTYFDLAKFVESNNKISFSASFGISDFDASKNKSDFEKFKSISVREDAGKKIIDDLNINKEVEVLIDPTMLLTAEEWDKVSKAPKQISKLNGKKYILNYFLGNLSEERKKEIQRIATENECEIINILEKNDPFFISGPSEFLWLEKNAFLICTDSFHSSVFAILYNRPFVIFNREDKTKSMNSRIETLISKFNLKNREYNGKNITQENLKHDYTEAYKILEQERIKSKKFLKSALDIDE